MADSPPLPELTPLELENERQLREEIRTESQEVHGQLVLVKLVPMGVSGVKPRKKWRKLRGGAILSSARIRARRGKSKNKT